MIVRPVILTNFYDGSMENGENKKSAVERNKHPHRGFSTFNVLFEKSVFSKIRFNEELKQYGHEDTLLGFQLKKAGIDILHIDNGLMHEGTGIE